MMKIGACTLLCTLRYIVEVHGLMYNVIELGIYISFDFQISYASSSPVLSDRNKFRSFFRNTFNMKIMAPALRSAIAHFNWTRIAIITQNEGLFTGVCNHNSYVYLLYINLLW